MSETTTFQAEYTDTFGGEANYSWCYRQDFTMPSGASNLAIVRKAKHLMGLSGLRCRSYDHGDLIELRPCGMATVLFITIVF